MERVTKVITITLVVLAVTWVVVEIVIRKQKDRER